MEDIEDKIENFKIRYIFYALLVIVIIGGLWGSFYRVSPGYQAVIFRLGNVIAVEGNGIHFKVPYIDDCYKVNTGNVRRLEFGYRSKEKKGKSINEVTEDSAKEAKMLTTAWHGGGLTQQLRTRVIAVWRGRRGRSEG